MPGRSRTGRTRGSVKSPSAVIHIMNRPAGPPGCASTRRDTDRKRRAPAAVCLSMPKMPSRRKNP